MRKNHPTDRRQTGIALNILAIVLVLCFIFGNSLQNGVESGNQSHQVQQVVNDVAASVGMDEPISEKFIRKAAHFGEFAVLGLLLCFDLLAFGLLTGAKKRYISLLLSLTPIPACALLAAVDEWIQTFSEGRAPQLQDVLLDTAGAASTVVLFALLFSLLHMLLQHRKKKKERAAASEQP